MIIGQNTLLNQQSLTLYLTDVKDGQGLTYDAFRKAFKNTNIGDTISTVGDLVDIKDVLVINTRQQYIITGTLEVLGRIQNNGRIAIL